MLEIRQALRALWRAKRLSLVVVTCLAVGIGANITIFSICEALLLKPLPGVTRPERLATLVPRSVRVPGLAVEVRPSLALDDLQLLAARSHAFSQLAAVQTQPLSLSAGEFATRVVAQIASPNLFAVLGTPCALGRCMGEAADLRERSVVVVSHDVWRHQLGGRTDAVGRIVRLDGAPFEVIGVAPPGFRGPGRDERPDVWLPLTSAPTVLPDLAGGRLGGKRWISHLVGRLAPGFSAAAAREEVNRALLRSGDASGDLAGFEVHAGLDPDPAATSRTVRPLALLLVFGTILLMTIWANVAGLLLGRTLARLDELGLRQALGAGRFRLARQLSAECGVLALLGGAAGGGLTALALRLLEGASLGESFPLLADLRLDGRIVLVAVLLTLVSGLVLGIVPGWYASRWNLAAMLRARTAGGPGRAQVRLYDLFVVGQVAASMALLLATGLLVQSFRHLAALDLGFQPAGVVHCRIDLTPARPAAAVGRQITYQILDYARGLPGVEAAALARTLPFESRHAERGLIQVSPEGAPPAASRFLAYDAVSAGYFQTLRIPLLAGRDLLSGPTAGERPEVVLDEVLAKTLSPSGSAIGRRLTVGGKLSEVVGIVGRVRQDGRGEPPRPYLYLPLRFSPAVSLALRVHGDPGGLVAAIRAQLGRLAPAAPLYAVGKLQDDVNASLAQSRVLARLFSAYSGAALLLAAIGLYGALTHLVRLHWRELGMRLALGARRESLMARILGRGIAITTVGLVLGMGVAALLGSVLRGLLFGVHLTDPGVVTSTTMLLLLVGALASLLPAVAAMRLDPAAVMRAE